LLIFLVANYYSSQFALTTHWSIKRAKIAERLFQYLNNYYPTLSKNQKIYFYDYDKCYLKPQKTEFSPEMSQALVQNKGLETFYHRKVDVLYQYLDPLEELEPQELILVPTQCLTTNL
jgi:hypothetical protein